MQPDARSILEAPIVDCDGEPVPPVVAPPPVAPETGAATTGPVGLRPYQADVLARARALIADGKRRLLVVAPTGSGKTVIGSGFIAGAVGEGRRALFLAHRRELIRQASEKLHANGIDHGVILEGYPARPAAPVQVASVQTLWARAVRSAAMALPPADVLMIDEAHHCRARSYEKIVGAYPGAVVVGLTATPCRGDGRGLGNAFDALVECPAVAELIALGWLVPTRCYAPALPDLSGVAVERGDYVAAQLARRMDRPALVGDVVSHWHRLAERRKTVVFAVDVAHSRHLCEAFAELGVAAAHLDGATPKDERDGILAQLARGELTVVCNCMVLTEGWDQPDVSCAVLARPTRHIGLFRQMVGRVLRPAPGKADAIVIDHSGAIHEHGFAEDAVVWTLRSDARAANPQHMARISGMDGRRLIACTRCSALRVGGDACRRCGWCPAATPKPVAVAEGELGRVARDRTVRAPHYGLAEREAWHAQLIWFARERGYKPGWAAMKYHERFGRFPPWGARPPEMAATPEVRAWIRSRQIAYARGRARADAAGDAAGGAS